MLSALSRMWTYQEAYGFTVLRLPDAGCVLRPVLRDLPDDSWPG